MASRPIPVIEKLDLLAPTDKLYVDSVAHPQNKTGWNEAANSMNGWHTMGSTSYQAHSSRANFERIPVCGNYGTSFVEEAAMDIPGVVIIPGGYDRFRIVGQSDNTSYVNGNMDTVVQKIEIYIDGILYVSITNTGVNNFAYSLPIGPGQLANPGEAKTANITLRSVKTFPTSRAGLGAGYRDGLISILIKPFKEL